MNQDVTRVLAKAMLENRSKRQYRESGTVQCRLGFDVGYWRLTKHCYHLVDRHQSLENCRSPVIRVWFRGEVSSGRCRSWVGPISVVTTLLELGFPVPCKSFSMCHQHGQPSGTYRFGKRRLPYSFDGEPAPALPPAPWAVPFTRPFPRGYLMPDPAGGSDGEFAVEVFVERGWVMLSPPSPSKLRL